jgi:DNA (cytosine-5)-methyltransferase 1
MILENLYDFYNGRLRNDKLAGTITTNCNCTGSGVMGVIEKKIVGAIFQEPTENEKGAFNLIEEDKVMVKELGYIDNGTGKHQSNTVYDSDNCSPTITTVKDGGTQQIKICEKIPCKLDKMPDGHLDSMDNAKLCDVGTETASTVTARYYKGIGAHKDNMCIESVKIKQATKQGYVECELGGVADLSYPTCETRRGRVENNGQICPTLTASENGICRIETRYRIRKLTPRECFRLMSFKDSDYDKAAEVNSQTQCYKEAGNSIVKVVMMAIMSQLNIKGVTPWNELSVEERSNLSGKIKTSATDSTNEKNGI